MYATQTDACTMPNSETPFASTPLALPQVKVTQVGQAMDAGNRDMAGLVGSLTPPAPTGTCDDFTSSLSMQFRSPWPTPAPTSSAPQGNGLGAAPSVSGTMISDAALKAALDRARGAAAAGAGPREGFNRAQIRRINGRIVRPRGVRGVGDYWTSTGGPSTYPWVGVQAQAEALSPPWSCPALGSQPSAAGAPATGGTGTTVVVQGAAGDTSNWWGWLLLGAAVLAVTMQEKGKKKPAEHHRKAAA